MSKLPFVQFRGGSVANARDSHMVKQAQGFHARCGRFFTHIRSEDDEPSLACTTTVQQSVVQQSVRETDLT